MLAMIGGRVSLGITERLSFGEGVGKRDTGLRHAREDVVGRAVDDSHDPADALARERLAQRANQRNASGHGRLEKQVDLGLGGGVEELGPGGRQKLLVAGDDRLARLEGPQD
jgi:hypothetical protein